MYYINISIKKITYINHHFVFVLIFNLKSLLLVQIDFNQIQVILNHLNHFRIHHHLNFIINSLP